MTKITFFRKNGVFYGFRETGHTGFGEEGDDILCSALSAMTMLIINTLEVVLSCPVDYKIDDETADVTLRCNSALPECESDAKKNFAASGMIEGYFVQLCDLVEEYYDYLDVDVVEE